MKCARLAGGRTQAPARKGGLAGRGGGDHCAGFCARDEVDGLAAVDLLPVGRARRRGDACAGSARASVFDRRADWDMGAPGGCVLQSDRGTLGRCMHTL